MNNAKSIFCALTLCFASIANAQGIPEPHFNVVIDVTTDHGWRLTGFEGFPANAVSIPELTGDFTSLHQPTYGVIFYPETTPDHAFHLTFTSKLGKTCAYYIGFEAPRVPLMIVTGDGNCTYTVDRNSLILSLG